MERSLTKSKDRVPMSVMGDIMIEDGIPLPPRRRSYTRWPFASMLPGQSFAAPKAHRISLQRQVWRLNRHPFYPGWHFEMRDEGENVRVWRTE
jgi:hypothetical protein